SRLRQYLGTQTTAPDPNQLESAQAQPLPRGLVSTAMLRWQPSHPWLSGILLLAQVRRGWTVAGQVNEACCSAHVGHKLPSLARVCTPRNCHERNRGLRWKRPSGVGARDLCSAAGSAPPL